MPSDFNIINRTVKKVQKTISTYHMIQKGDAVLVCVSGGSDSVALLDLLMGMATKFSIKIGIAHLNHGLRPVEAGQDQKFVESLAKKFNLPFHMKKKNILKYRDRHKLSIEEAARQVRYHFFYQVAEKYLYHKIALGHHEDDNAELVLMNLFRGSGPLGLSGMPPVRNKRVIRPLIQLSKIEIIEYLKLKNIDHITDQSNKDNRFTRNRIRNHLIPLIQESFNPKLCQSINQYATIMREEEDWINNMVKSFFQNMILYSDQEHITLSLSKFNQCHLAEKRRILRYAIKVMKGDLRRISFTHIDSILNLLNGKKLEGHLDLPESVKIKCKKDEITIFKAKNETNCSVNKKAVSEKIIFQYSLVKPAQNIESINISEIGMRMNYNHIDVKEMPNYKASGSHVEFFDMDQLNFPLILRNVEPGDRFVPLGMNGKQKIKKFFINNKVLRKDRRKCPILLNKNDIIWIVGFRRSDYAKVTPETRNILKIDLLLA